MPHIILTIGTATLAFIATNIDDILLLTLLFSQVNATFRKIHIVAGHYLGFAAILALSLIGMAGALLLPRTVVALLGIIPILIGLYHIFRKSPGENEQLAEGLESLVTHNLFSGILSTHTASVAAVTLANSADNLSIYVPFFVNNRSDVPLIIVVFLVLTGVWCYMGYRLVRDPVIARLLDRYSERLVPYVFIVLGLYIIVKSLSR